MNIRKKFNNVLITIGFLFVLLTFLDVNTGKKSISRDEPLVHIRPIVKPKKVEEKVYDFLIPKEGKVKSLTTSKVSKIYRREHKEKRYASGYGLSLPDKMIYAIVKPSVSKDFYYANAYLNGYVPFKAKSVWNPLELLRIRITYLLDKSQYKGRTEVWQTAKDSLNRSFGDCEDHSIVLADWLIGLGYDARIALGEVQFRGQGRGGHAWVVLFDEGKEYILESTSKEKWRQLPLASSLPYYYPKFMFNRKDFWSNIGSIYTVKYSGKKWVKSGSFIPKDKYYPDLHTHALYIETNPSDVNIKILNKQEEFYQGIQLRTGKYNIEISKEGYSTRKGWINIRAKDLHLKKDLSVLL